MNNTINEILSIGLDKLKSSSPLVHAVLVALAVFVLNYFTGNNLLGDDVNWTEPLIEFAMGYLFNVRTKRHLSTTVERTSSASLTEYDRTAERAARDFDD